MTKEEFKRNIVFAKEISNITRLRNNLRNLLDSDRREEMLVESLEKNNNPGLATAVRNLPNPLPEPLLLKEIRENSDIRLDVISRWALCFLYSSLTVYIETELEEVEYPIDDWAEKKSKDGFKKDMHELRIKRNVIIHSASKWDSGAIGELNEWDIDLEPSVGKEIEVGPSDVEEYIEKVKNFILK